MIMRSSNLQFFRRSAIAGPRWSRRRYRLACLPLLLLVMLTGCGGGPDRAVSSPNYDSAEQSIGKQDPVSVPGVESCRLLSRLVVPAPSDPQSELPAKRLPCLTKGPSVDLSLVRGKPVLVNLWASWCGPCRKEMPILQAAYTRYGQRIQFVGVDTSDDAEVAAPFLAKVGVTYPQLADSDAALLKHLRIPGLPVTLIIGEDGSVVERHIGAFEARDLNDLLNRMASP